MTQNNHSCPAILFVCLDWRLHPEIENYFQKEYNNYDLCVSAGSLKDLIAENTQDYFLSQIECSRKLHNSQTVVLTMHQDCGAYGGTANFESAEDEFNYYQKVMEEAKLVVLKKFPEAKVIKYFIGLELKENKWVSDPKRIND